MSESHSTDQERWAPVVGYEGLYEVSDIGRVRSIPRVTAGGRHGALRRRAGKLRSLNVGSNGYAVVTLSRDGREATKSVHRLVAAAFLPPPPSGRVVNHKNGVKADNRASNLEWATPSENNLHSYRAGLSNAKGSANGQSKLTEAAVVAIRARLSCGEKQPVIAAAFGVHRRTVSDIARGKTWQSVTGG